MMKDKVIFVTKLIEDLEPVIDAADDEMHITFYHWGSEGQKMETTLIVTDIIEDELDH